MIIKSLFFGGLCYIGGGGVSFLCQCLVEMFVVCVKFLIHSFIFVFVCLFVYSFGWLFWSSCSISHCSYAQCSIGQMKCKGLLKL